MGLQKGPRQGLFVRVLAERTGLEPATPGVTGRYSNQLNYRSLLYFALSERGAPVSSRRSVVFPWWVLTGSNRRHSPCKSDALPAELSTRKRGASLLHPSMLCQRESAEHASP